MDFVGSQHGVKDGEPLYPDFDQDHEGHWGWGTVQVLANINSWASQVQPDIILIHLGHNDLWEGRDIANTIGTLGQLIDELRVVNPDIKVLLAQIIPTASLPQISDLNAQISVLAAEKDTPQSSVIAVDQYAGFDASVDTWDGVHPDESGERRIADRWFASLTDILGHRRFLPTVFRQVELRSPSVARGRLQSQASISR